MKHIKKLELLNTEETIKNTLFFMWLHNVEIHEPLSNLFPDCDYVFYTTQIR